MSRLHGMSRFVPVDRATSEVVQYGEYGDPVVPGFHYYLNLRDFPRILNRHRFLIVAMLGAGLLAGFVYNSMATRVFEARTSVQIESEQNVLALERPLVEQREWMSDFLPTQVRILESRDMARLAHEHLRLLHRTDVSGPGASSFASNELSADEDGRGVPSVDDIIEGRTVSPIRNTRVIEIAFSSTNAEQAARVANALAQTYVQQNVRSRMSTTSEASEWLTKQVEEQRKIVQASEAALKSYRERNRADALFTDREGAERQNIVVQRLADLQAEVTRARSETIAKAAQYSQFVAVQAKEDALDTLPAIVSNTYIHGLKGELSALRRQMAQLSQELGERHPDRIKLEGAIQEAERKLQAEMSNAAQAMRNDLEATRLRERSLVSALEQQKAEVQALNAKSGQYSALEREVASNREVLDRLLQRSREAGLARELKSTSARIVDAAEVPRKPIRPRKARNMMLGLFASGVSAFGLVLLLEIVSRRITSPDEVTRHLGIPVLGIAPEVTSHNGHGSLLLTDRPPARYTELFHGLRTNLLVAPELANARSLVVTSSEPGEGKTLTAANIAASLAQLNQRVLLVDADLRRPGLHQLFRQEQEPGLTDLLAKSFFEIDCELRRATAASAFRKTKMAGLWLLPAGSASRNPADLVGSDRFGQLIDMLQPQFDWIILDSPPVLAVTDSCLLSRVASGVLFVVGCGRTTRDAAGAAVQQLNAAGANLVGAMLNRVSLGRPGESYLPYYHREYPKYYPTQDQTWVPDVSRTHSVSEPTRSTDTVAELRSRVPARRA